MRVYVCELWTQTQNVSFVVVSGYTTLYNRTVTAAAAVAFRELYDVHYDVRVEWKPVCLPMHCSHSCVEWHQQHVGVGGMYRFNRPHSRQFISSHYRRSARPNAMHCCLMIDTAKTNNALSIEQRCKRSMMMMMVMTVSISNISAINAPNICHSSYRPPPLNWNRCSRTRSNLIMCHLEFERRHVFIFSIRHKNEKSTRSRTRPPSLLLMLPNAEDLTNYGYICVCKKRQLELFCFFVPVTLGMWSRRRQTNICIVHGLGLGEEK